MGPLSVGLFMVTFNTGRVLTVCHGKLELSFNHLDLEPYNWPKPLVLAALAV